MLYNLIVKKDKILHYQSIVLQSLSNKIDNFYLAGGTALSVFYFQHRVSFDLDFFTPQFSHKRIQGIIAYLKTHLKPDYASDGRKIEITLTAQNLKNDTAKMMVYYIYFSSRDILKIDFAEDTMNLIKETKIVEGIRILSLEDIYLRKIYTITGVMPVLDEAGKKKFIGGRAEAKDLFDIYFLSHTFMPLSRFVKKYGNPTIKEGLISWFRSYDRMRMRDGILNLDTDKGIDYKTIEKHLNKEIDKIIESEIEKL